jgi:hypothetical protein
LDPSDTPVWGATTATPPVAVVAAAAAPADPGSPVLSLPLEIGAHPPAAGPATAVGDAAGDVLVHVIERALAGPTPSRLQRAWAATVLVDALEVGPMARRNLVAYHRSVLVPAAPTTVALPRLGMGTLLALPLLLRPDQWGRVVLALRAYLHAGESFWGPVCPK